VKRETQREILIKNRERGIERRELEKGKKEKDRERKRDKERCL